VSTVLLLLYFTPWYLFILPVNISGDTTSRRKSAAYSIRSSTRRTVESLLGGDGPRRSLSDSEERYVSSPSRMRATRPS
jgi:hypothetical protein